MSIDIAAGVRARFVGDSTLTNLIDVYGGEPAILVDPVPSDLVIGEKPVLIIAEPYDDPSADDYSTERRNPSLRVRLYAKQSGSTLVLNAAAQRVRSLLKHWNTPSFSTGELEGAIVSGPTPAPTDDPTIEGRLLSVQLFIRE